MAALSEAYACHAVKIMVALVAAHIGTTHADYNLAQLAAHNVTLESMPLLECDDVRNADTRQLPNLGGNGARDDFVRFRVLGRHTTLRMDTCGSAYDTFLRVLTLTGREVYRCDDCGSCGTRTIITILPYNSTHHQGDLTPGGHFSTGVGTFFENGEYILVIEGFSSQSGSYGLRMLCSDSNGAPSAAPTFAPTAPTMAPTSAQPTRSPTISPTISPTTDPCRDTTCSRDCRTIYVPRPSTTPWTTTTGRRAKKSPRHVRNRRSAITLEEFEADDDDAVAAAILQDWQDGLPDPVRRRRQAQGSGSGSGSGFGSGNDGIRFQCGWDRDLGLCVTGGNTTDAESNELFEATPGGCSHYTVSPTSSPTAPTAAPSVSPTVSPTTTPTTYASNNPIEIVLSNGPFSSLSDADQQQLISALILELFNGTLEEGTDVDVSIRDPDASMITFVISFRPGVSVDPVVVNGAADEEVVVALNGVVFASANVPTTPASDTESSTGDSDSSSTGMIIGIVIAVLIVLLLLGLLLAWRQSQSREVDPNLATSDTWGGFSSGPSRPRNSVDNAAMQQPDYAVIEAAPAPGPAAGVSESQVDYATLEQPTQATPGESSGAFDYASPPAVLGETGDATGADYRRKESAFANPSYESTNVDLEVPVSI